MPLEGARAGIRLFHPMGPLGARMGRREGLKNRFEGEIRT